ncbi:recombinase family protein [Roseomonas frigidaquae]|uniref:Recombinase family protein n=1 Tax=Falsiroseomonas frigidaquae TaxID=487318 RepID=A0ABX1F5X4_9PROT|nr:recombinase family protein [Falsiroseomonas frigidaquae]NKE47626.1 recombinase family protein [Falsiroseomonas frigidaquae]
MTKAYSYLRFSTPEQATGDSTRRQRELAEKYAAKTGLELDDSLSLNDPGISAYYGRNANKGALAAFLRAVEDGIVESGSYLLVENLDRLSRQSPWEAMPVFQSIINSGITIVTVQDEKVYNKKEMVESPFRIFESLMVMIRANEESATKGRRLREAWKAKRAAASSEPMTSRVPAWLKMNKSGEAIEIDLARMEIIRHIFDLYEMGKGAAQIARMLDAEGIQTFGDGPKQKRKAMYWHKTYIQKILSNEAVVGVIIPHQVEYSSGRKGRKALDAIAGYYPAVISREQFDRVQLMREGKANGPRVRAEKGELQSLVAGLAFCIFCGLTMTRVNKGSSSKAGKPRLVCVKARRGDCTAPSYPLEDIENAITSRAYGFADLLADKPNVTAGAGLHDVAMHELKQTELMLTIEIEALINLRLTDRRSTLRDRQDVLEAKLEEIKAAMTWKLVRQNTASEVALHRRATACGAMLAAVPLDRSKANAMLRQMIHSIGVMHDEAALEINWHRGGSTLLSIHGKNGSADFP